MASLLSKPELHERFLAAIGSDAVVSASTVAAGELVVELRPPLPRRLRVYIYNATNPPGGRATPEHKIQLILANQGRGQRGNFDRSGVEFVLLCGYVPEEDVFVFWDAALHADFAYSKNLQVRSENVADAAAAGVTVRQERSLRTDLETVLCVPSRLVADAIAERFAGPILVPQGVGVEAPNGQPYLRPLRSGGGESALRVFSVDPLFDIGWIVADTAWIAEVKSLTESNEDRQLRLGLGQVLSYAYLVDWGAVANRPVLAVERKPSAPHWPDLCASHGVKLSWPETFEEMLDACA